MQTPHPTRRAFACLLLPLLLATAGATSAGAPAAEAKQLFQRYVELGQSFDGRLADLYADNAVIRNKRIAADGQVRELTIPAPQYKQLIRQLMATAQARGDRNTYTNVKYAPEGKGVRITASRHSELKRYTSPLSILVAPAASGGWLIVEELSESRQ
jgi:hypothetical protein